jgi:hypothetical protein
LHILVDCVLTSISKVQQVGKLDGISHSAQMKANSVLLYWKIKQKTTVQMELMKWLLCCGIS